MEHKKELFTIYSILFTEHLGWSLILPFLPFFVTSLNASPIYVGIILSSFSFLQFFSAPIIGKLSDKFGRKPMLLLSQSATAISFLILANANSVFMILLSRIVDGLIGSNMTLVNAYITDIVKGKERLKIFGYSGIVFSLGMFVGPAIGGFLAQISYSIPSYIAFALSALTIIFTVVFLKESNPRKKDVKIAAADFFPLKDFLSGFRNENLRCIFFEFFFFIFSFNIFISSLSLISQYQLGLGTDDVGMFFMFISAVRIMFQIFAFPRLISRFKRSQLIKSGMIIMIIGLLNIYFTTSLSGVYFTLLCFSIGGPLIRPSIISKISEQINDSQRGKYLGVSDSLASISQIIAPMLGAFVIENYYPGILGIVSAAFMAVSLMFEIFNPCSKNHVKVQAEA